MKCQNSDLFKNINSVKYRIPGPLCFDKRLSDVEWLFADGNTLMVYIRRLVSPSNRQSTHLIDRSVGILRTIQAAIIMLQIDVYLSARVCRPSRTLNSVFILLACIYLSNYLHRACLWDRVIKPQTSKSSLEPNIKKVYINFNPLKQYFENTLPSTKT